MKLSGKIKDQVEKLLENHEPEPDHIRQVARLADSLFTGLQSWHGLDQRCRVLLQVAGLLHDIGWSQSPTGAGHHKESARLIRSWSWQGLPEGAIRIVALVARYHRRVIPKPCHPHYRDLGRNDQRTVEILAAILRVADALDRSHASVVQSLQVGLEDRQVNLSLGLRQTCEPELRAVKKKKDLLELVSHRRLVVNVPSTFTVSGG